MDVYDIKIDSDAFIDIKEAADWYDYKSDGLGGRFKRNVKRQINSLKSNPEIYNIRYKNVRCVLVKKFPFLIHFIVDKKNWMVEVLAVIHTSRNPKIWEQKEK
jgi:hypothetical protein